MISSRGALARENISCHGMPEVGRSSNRFAPPPRVSSDWNYDKELPRSSSARTLSAHAQSKFSASAREPWRAVSNSLERVACTSRNSSRGRRPASVTRSDSRQRLASPHRSDRQRPVSQGRSLDADLNVDSVQRFRRPAASMKDNGEADGATDVADGAADAAAGIPGTHADTVAAVSSLPDLLSTTSAFDGGFCGSDLRMECARLRHSLQQFNRRIEQKMREVSEGQAFVLERQSEQQAEAVELLEELRVLSTENKKLEAGARNGRNAAWRLKAALRAHEADVEIDAEEATEKHRRLEQENARLRKEAAALRTRLLCWRRAHQRLARSPSRLRALFAQQGLTDEDTAWISDVPLICT